MRRQIATVWVAVSLVTILCVNESLALTYNHVVRDYSVSIGRHQFGVQDYDGGTTGSGTLLLAGPYGVHPLPIGSRVALAITLTVLLALAALVAYSLSFKAANNPETR